MTITVRGSQRLVQEADQALRDQQPSGVIAWACGTEETISITVARDFDLLALNALLTDVNAGADAHEALLLVQGGTFDANQVG